jgi:Cu-processing system ATP-binding protein
MIEIDHLHKRFGPLAVLQGLSARCEPGRITAVLGPNGAGKTTLIKCILGLVRPDAGEVRFNGQRLADGWQYRREIGYMPQAAHFPENLSAHELLRFLKDLRGQPQWVDESLLDALHLGPEMHKPFRTLSGGTRQKVSAATAFLFNPATLILDEPTAGLDPVASSCVKDHILRARASGRTVVLTSHLMSEVDELADHLFFLGEGQVWLEGTPATIKARTGAGTLERAVAYLMAGGQA